MRVDEIMCPEVVGVTPGTSLRDVARLLLVHGISGAPVLSDEGKVLGVVSEGDLLVKAAAGLGRYEHPSNWLFGDDEGVALKRRAQTAAEAMSCPAITIDPRCSVAEAARLMVKRSVNRLPVVDEGRLVGIVTRADVVRAFARPDPELLEQICTEVLLETLWIDPAAVDVTVDEGRVTVSGEVETRTVAELVPAYVSLVPGVVSVDVSRLEWRTETRVERRHASRL
jgi:CBS-domain-containing membrane protein